MRSVDFSLIEGILRRLFHGPGVPFFHQNRPEMRYPRGMYDFAGKSFCSRLRDLGCPDTLVKDVRDVAAAVMCSEGPGQSEEV